MVAPVTVVPFKNHWYDGAVPPFNRVAEKVTGVPAQTGFAEAEIDTLTGSNGLTVMVIVLDAAGFPAVQVSLEFSTQLIVFPLTGVKV